MLFVWEQQTEELFFLKGTIHTVFLKLQSALTTYESYSQENGELLHLPECPSTFWRICVCMCLSVTESACMVVGLLVCVCVCD